MRKITAFFISAVTALLCVPCISGCSAKTEYILKTDGDGNKYYIAGCSGFASNLKGEVVIPSYYGEGEDYAPVTEISEQGFSATSITKITIPATVTKIGQASFAYNNLLESVVFENGSKLEEISRGAFGYCPALKEISLPATVKSVGIMAFYNCTSLESVGMHAVENIGGRAFEYCSSLREVTFPETLGSIGDRAFYFSGLKEVSIPDSVFEIGYASFHSCTSLEKASVGAGVRVIKSGAFGYCTSLKELCLSSSVEKIEGARYVDDEFYCGHAFHSCGISDVYYGGTAEEWEELKKNTDNKSVTVNDTVFDNGALFGAKLHIG